MSPGPVLRAAGRVGFPRVSGDEPFVGLAAYAGQLFSPRERG